MRGYQVGVLVAKAWARPTTLWWGWVGGGRFTRRAVAEWELEGWDGSRTNGDWFCG